MIEGVQLGIWNRSCS